MSIVRMVALGAERQKERPQPSGRPTSGRTDETARAADTALDKIAAFIPSEAIGTYIAGLGIIAPQSQAGKWVIFAICSLLIIVIMQIGYGLAKKRSLPVPSSQILVLQFAFAFLAFGTWACAMPDTPFLAFTDQATKIGGFSAVVLAVIMPKLAEFFDMVPQKA